VLEHVAVDDCFVGRITANLNCVSSIIENRIALADHGLTCGPALPVVAIDAIPMIFVTAKILAAACVGSLILVAMHIDLMRVPTVEVPAGNCKDRRIRAVQPASRENQVVPYCVPGIISTSSIAVLAASRNCMAVLVKHILLNQCVCAGYHREPVTFT
jgi:hypothetical protein